MVISFLCVLLYLILLKPKKQFFKSAILCKKPTVQTYANENVFSEENNNLVCSSSFKWGFHLAIIANYGK